MDTPNEPDQDFTGGNKPADRSSVTLPIGNTASRTGAVSSGNSIPDPSPIDGDFGTLDYTPIADDVLTLASNLYFRQSMLRDYLTCPMMMLYKWIIGHEEEDTFFAAILGTAGHSVIEAMHLEKNVKSFTYTTIDVMSMFQQYGELALSSSHVPPKLGAQFNTLTAQLNSASSEYTQMLQGYAHDPRNQDFNVTVREQMFALCITSNDPSTPGDYIFTGTIDQAGFYGDGSFALRDIKFRAQNFKPGPVQLKLDIQLSLYAYALKHGSPCCQECRPRYSSEGQLLYIGPCNSCEQLIGTAAWPRLIAERVELVWMRDYLKRKKDEHAKEIISDTEMEINPDTGRKRKRRELNPNWVHGYKIGDPMGPAILKTDRSNTFLNIHMADMIRVAFLIKSGQFFRKSGDHCNFWCKFKQPCLDMLETQIEELDMSTMNDRVATIDPFGDN